MLNECDTKLCYFRELSGIVYSLYDLLLTEAKLSLQGNPSFESCYNLVSKHPFVMLLMDNKDIFSRMFVYIQQFYMQNNEKYNLYIF